jgi:hypothetical protein
MHQWHVHVLHIATKGGTIPSVCPSGITMGLKTYHNALLSSQLPHLPRQINTAMLHRHHAKLLTAQTTMTMICKTSPTAQCPGGPVTTASTPPGGKCAE